MKTAQLITATGAKSAKESGDRVIHGTHGKPGQAPGQVNADWKTSSAQECDFGQWPSS